MHPFLDGNGRTARASEALMLQRLGLKDTFPARLWQANHAFQALEMPQGRHEVTLAYEDRVF